jgi:cytochrome c oxidase subunit IV
MGGHGHSHSEVGHVIPVKVFTTVLTVLLVLTAITVAVARVDFGEMNIVVAMVVASIKAFLVVYYFMHGAHENKIVLTYVILPFVLLIILVGGTLMDDTTRIYPEPVIPAAAPLPKF